MRRPALPLLFLSLAASSAILLDLEACGGAKAYPLRLGQGKIQHIVVVVQEDRTPDNLFHDPVLMARGADIATVGVSSRGAKIPLTAAPLAVDYDLDHHHSSFAAMYHNGQMNGAASIPTLCGIRVRNCPNLASFQYVKPSDVAPYFQLAEQYTFADRMFQTNQGPSFPAHQFIFSGTSAPTATSKLFAAENPMGEAGCAASPQSYVSLIGPLGEETSSTYPCFEHPAISDELDAQGLSWRYYTPAAGSIWTAPNSIQHICGPNAAPPNATACVGPTWANHVVLYNPQNPAPSSPTSATTSYRP